MFFFLKNLKEGQRKGSVFSVNRWMFLLMNALVVFCFDFNLFYHSHLFLRFFLFIITQTWLPWFEQRNSMQFFHESFFLVFGVNGFGWIYYFYRRLSDWRVIHVPMSLKLAAEWTCESTPRRLFWRKLKWKKRDRWCGLLNF